MSVLESGKTFKQILLVVDSVHVLAHTNRWARAVFPVQTHQSAEMVRLSSVESYHPGLPPYSEVYLSFAKKIRLNFLSISGSSLSPVLVLYSLHMLYYIFTATNVFHILCNMEFHVFLLKSENLFGSIALFLCER